VIVCDECGRENDDDYKFCLGCGSPLSKQQADEPDEDEAEMIRCPYCGSEQPANFKFCGSCGEEIPEEASGSQPAVDTASEPSPSGGTSTDASAAEGSKGTSPSGGRPAPGDAPGMSEGRPSTSPGGGSAPPSPISSSDMPAVSKAEDAVGRLIVIRPDGTEGASIEIPDDSLLIGRNHELEALASDPFLSPIHAKITPEDGQFVIRDRDSVNGIFREVQSDAPLTDGDEIRIGQELLRFETVDGRADQNDETLAAGSPDPGHWGRLVVVAGPDIETEAYALSDEEVTIGRQNGDIVFRDDGFVSSTHAQLAKTENGMVLRDLDSSNGTFLRLSEDYVMDPGERVLMGQQLFRIED
jgi:pSer/pThr/pTyr-binding forkhead associated (FHA) protein/DNA-directed RNA polymerase subunit RPC12/RpoP